MSTHPDSEFPPSGCHHCGLDRRLHFQRWSDAAGWHGFTEPTRERITERMRARYAGRTTTPTTNEQPRS